MFGPLTVKPKESKGDKTGSWRTQFRPEYLHKNCIACRMCAMICPEGCVYGKEKNSFWVDFNFCKGCGVCADICPKKDIAMVVEDGKSEEK
ncbi:MAG: 4Fe-4S binding protein [Candidatus Omnitrophica bacterium]|jgi:pyruvate ferredoxin oxidoreductase delta subunit|nr:4Fe-4S binding protein [Candidatus Omnitrophota bacterium]MDD3274695.1 4Fe-4S binding protein [Candidatus Omnitrophota bacterium]MDD5077697.1 4Fe-4S binding protein [Candidatus Omnitrophota bacterium]MDD5725667.1 4Fe-4S binding protein [Candidatus Omnitrophota bacterium]